MNAIEKFANTAANILWGLRGPRFLSAEQKAAVKIVAHRGVHGDGIIENSRESFALAAENNIWGIEFDVRFTADNVPVIHHDPDCQRLYNCPVFIEKITFSELKQKVPQIPSLEEVVTAYGRRLHLLIEIKEQLSTEQEKILAASLASLRPDADFHLLSLNPAYLENITFAPKSAFMAVAWVNMADILKTVLRLGHGGVSGPFVLLNNSTLKTCKSKGLVTGTGFIETKGALFYEINRGIDWIFTNHPLRLKAYLA